MSDLTGNEPIIVDSVAQEYVYIGRQHCPCGGRWRPVSQSLLQKGEEHFDLIKTRCESCGREAEFLFDISSFFGRQG